MHELPKRFNAALRGGQLSDHGQHVLVACSGGIDSVVLLYLFRFACDLQLELSVAHLDHRMRQGSAADAEWLRGLCCAWELVLHGGQAERVLKSEAEARTARYRFLEATADSVGADRIATAHHSDDQAETVLFRILRGTGLDGLAGIPARRGRIIRPLLAFGRAELEAFAREHSLSWRADPSNRSRAYARNRIRLDVLPALEGQWPGAGRALMQVARDASRARRAWEALLGQFEQPIVTAQDATSIELARPLLLKYHPEIRARLLRRWLARLGHAPGRSGTAALAAFISAGESGTGIHLKGGLRVTREFETVRLSRPGLPPEADQPLEIGSASAGSGQTTIGGARYHIRWSLGADSGGDDSVALDPAAVLFPLAIRAWRPGDRIRLPIGTKKLKKLFAERRLGREHRQTVPVLVDTEGTVLWVAGLARSAAAQPPQNRAALCITVRNGESD